MYRTRTNYIAAIVLTMAFVFAMPHARASFMAWLHGGWRGTLNDATGAVRGMVNSAHHARSQLIEGQARNEQWRASASWVQHIEPGAVYGEVHPVRILRWIDGDTVDVLMLREHKKVRVRLAGVDTLEIHGGDKARRDAHELGKSEAFLSRLGRVALAYVRRIMPEGSEAGLSFPGEAPSYGRYHRLIGYLHTRDGQVINERMVREGVARAYGIGSRNDIVYHAMEAKARIKKRGIWRYL